HLFLNLMPMEGLHKPPFSIAEEGGLPRFKKVKRYKSFTLKQTAGLKLRPDIKVACDKSKQRGVGLVQIGKIAYKYVKHRELQGLVKTVTIMSQAF
ncbi:MAG: hypothetical protein WBC91_05605, partial [Phototrophicaceae bacterium]